MFKPKTEISQWHNISRDVKIILRPVWNCGAFGKKASLLSVKSTFETFDEHYFIKLGVEFLVLKALLAKIQI